MGVNIDGQGVLLLAPVLWVAAAAVAALLGDVFLRGRSKVALSYISLTGIGLALYAMGQAWTQDVETLILGGSVAVSSLSYAAGLGLLVAAALSSLAAAQYAPGTGVATGEYHGLVLFATAGGLVLVIANDIVTLFVALETMSLSVYALTGIARGRSTAAEGAMKYFIMGAVASGFLLYGAGMLYGATGTLQLFPLAGAGADQEVLSVALATPARALSGPLAMTGLSCVLLAMLFKVGAVPFHAWVPDAYQGAPAPSTGFMSVAVKAAAFVAILKLVTAVGRGAGEAAGVMEMVSGMLFWVAALTMILGNFGALLQDDPKRMLGYSGIAHTGYALVAIVTVAVELRNGGAADQASMANAGAALLFYLLGYAVTNLTAFAMLSSVERGGADIRRIDDLAGLAERAPLRALAMLVAMISLAGIPLTAGFTGKVWLFQAGLRGDQEGLVILGLLTSIVSLYYYLRIVVVMYMKPPSVAVQSLGVESRWTARFATGLGLLGILWLGLYPLAPAQWVQDGARALFPG